MRESRSPSPLQAEGPPLRVLPRPSITDQSLAQEPLDWVGTSDASLELVRQLQMAGASSAPVLLEGETGVGKDLAARLVHKYSARRGRSFLAINATSLGETLFESELFGHLAGSFSDTHQRHDGLASSADGGTLFLDEIGELNRASQSKLLRFLDHREVRAVGSCETLTVDVRIVCATNRDLFREVEQGRFRRDLYYRLRVLSIRIPPLRERREDIAPLARAFCDRFCERFRKSYEGLDPAALDVLMAYDWPGNVRELANEIKRAVVLMPHPRSIGVDLLSAGFAPGTQGRPAEGVRSLKQRSRELEKKLVLESLERQGWNISATARELDMSRVGLAKKMRLLGLRRSGGQSTMN